MVGDLNVGEMEGKIKEVFGGVPAVKTTGYKEYPLEYTEKVAYQEMQDTLITRSALELILPKVTTVQSTYGDRLQKIKERLLMSAVNARFKAQGSRVSLSDNWYLSDKDHLVFSIDGEHGTEIKGKIVEVVSTLKQIREQGFCEPELARLKKMR